MTVRDRVREVAKDEYVYIGAKTGAGWMVIAKGSEVMVHCRAEDIYQKGRLKKRIKTLDREIYTNTQTLDKMRDSLITFDMTAAKGYTELKQAISNKESKIFETKAKLEITEIRLATYQPILDRTVVEHYEKKADVVGALALLTNGMELGRWWDLGERIRGYEPEEGEEDAEEFDYRLPGSEMLE